MQNGPVLAKFKGESLVFKVEGGLHFIKGNGKPYFSLTASGYDHGSAFGGCCHEVILEHFPQFADLAALHLSDIDGIPMHAEANAWYQLAGYFGGAGQEYHAGNSKRHCAGEYREPNATECLQSWADYIRIPIDQAKAIADQFAAKWNWPDMRAAHRAWIAAQAERWKAEADACIAKHGLIVFGDDWEAGK